MTGRLQILERRRRDMAAAYAKAVRGHAPRAILARQMVDATCAALREELRASKSARASAAKSAGKAAGPDLFSLFGEAA